MTAKPGLFFAFALAAISFVGPLAVHLFLPVIPAVKAALHLSSSLAQLTFSIALFGMAFSTLFYGSLSDRYGRRPVLLSGLALFLVGSAISAFAVSVSTLVLGRLVQAIGAGCGITLGHAIAQDVYGPQHLVKVIAYLTMAYTIGPMISPIVGGILIDAFGWRSAFAFALVFGAVIAVCAYFVIFETRPPSPNNQVRVNVLRSYGELFGHVRFSNRPFRVKRFQTNHHHSSVDVAHGPVLLFGIGTRPFHHGSRRRGGTIYRAAYRAALL
jgi:DHA1 family bicyclomycin/chloramphenicol resistance-like MFS transporter